jgi:ankyrin repeat protein
LGLITKREVTDLAKRGYPMYHNGMMQMLIDIGADIRAFTSANQQALSRAVNNHDTALLSLLLRANPPPDVNQKYQDGRTLLFQVSNSYPVLKMLLDAGADPTIPDRSGRIPLFEAREADTIAALLDAAPHSINHVDAAGRNVLMNNCSGQRSCHFLSRLDTLDTAARDYFGDTVLHKAMSMLRKEVIEKLLTLPLDVFAIGNEGCTVMMSPFATPGHCRRGDGSYDPSHEDEDRNISTSLIMIANYILHLPLTQGRSRTEPGDADTDSAAEEADAKRRRVC